MKKSYLLGLVAGVIVFTSCVPEKKFSELDAKYKACQTDIDAAKKASIDAENKSRELEKTLADERKEFNGLKRDTSILGTNYRNLTVQYDKLNTVNRDLIEQIGKLKNMADAENTKLSGKLQMTQDQLNRKEDDLKKMELDLKKLELELATKKQQLDATSEELKKREARVNELESLIKQKDQASNDLKKKLSDALFAFENKGLTITQKDGKVYVSLDESLLFASGKTAVEAKGVEALKSVAKVLEANPDINIMVEGHTDDVPMKGAGDIKDNWDLSVMRATAVTKILLTSSTINPKRITSAGRGEFFPLDAAKTAEARKKNRRTEIILTPKLDEIMKVLGGN